MKKRFWKEHGGLIGKIALYVLIALTIAYLIHTGKGIL